MIDQLWLIPLGFAAGLLGSMIGLGGGIIVVPILTFLGFPPTAAASNSLFAALSNATASTISYSKQKRIEYSLGIKLGLLSIPGTILGAIISTDIAPDIFKILFGFVLIASAVYIFLRKKIETKEKTISKQMIIFAIGVSFFAGIISSFFGIGGGIIFVPLMVVGMGMAMKKAAPTSQMILLFASLSGVIVHSLLGHPDFLQAGMLSIGSFIGGLVGARLSIDIKERYLQILVVLVILIAAAKLFFDSLSGNINLGF
ncbi:MAG: sulfite exporter TauE/SafE family protein [Nitrosopumilus sp.]|nr:sulfite exporter TauE/SafE family protein [Nitrosopumilus sp.]MDF2423460.1 sulfite exporter TauE/SafE family protein [Nitrosopumilus sp.]MDF2424054.1 sulfite exporter TauE/SafE family protein [Nitrosopumilus sp.]MDF2425846.1 sulfite exporter TauE/SafE family protein [Nitrosopumilus sp.]MDF2427396.1 sulfite exporter TauE/SafE family protein [Nitrosopumilus sp.]